MLREKSTLIATCGCVCVGVWWIIVYAGGCLYNPLILRLVTQEQRNKEIPVCLDVYRV